MKSVKLEFEHVDYPIDFKTIQMLGEENGESMYIIKTYNSFKQFIGIDKETNENIYDDVVSINIKTMNINKAISGWIAIINGNFYHDYKAEKILEICKLEF